ncbi:MAG TPA: NAD(P)-dependent oxidoreductase [Chitinophagaceae bacterium]|nr:NAD(P)-dependent oxidoreductase [Chitinophagaceae bacterium]
MKKKLLITGASGFLGYHLIEAALLQGYEVYAGVRGSSNTAHLDTTKVTIVQLDMSDIAALQNVLRQYGIGYIIHAAALTRAKTPELYNFSNALLTRNLATAALEAGIQKFVFISSLAAIGPSADGRPLKEEVTPQPVTWYGRSKQLAENYLRALPALPFIVLRPTAVYGPREKDLFLLVQSVVRGIEVYIGRSPQKLSFVYVKDVASIAVHCLASTINGEFYNLSDGHVYNQYSFADAAKKVIGKKTVRLHLPLSLIKKVAAGMDILYSRSSKTPVLNKDKVNELTAADWSCSIEKIQQQQGFRPAYNLETGMAETIEWYRKQQWM